MNDSLITFFSGVACGVVLGVMLSALSIVMMDSIERKEK